nr:hypothetical protein [Mesorhizobium sp. NZP2234]
MWEQGCSLAGGVQAAQAYFALAFEPPLPITEAASEAAPRAVATIAPAAIFAAVRTAPDLAGAGWRALAVFAAGTTFLGAALPKAPLASFERSAIAGPAPAFAWVAFAGLVFAGFFALVAIGKSLTPDKRVLRDNDAKLLRFPSRNTEN